MIPVSRGECDEVLGTHRGAGMSAYGTLATYRGPDAWSGSHSEAKDAPAAAVCTENLYPDIVVMKSAKDCV